MFEQAFKNIDDVLRKEAGCTTELDYTEQTSWLLSFEPIEPPWQAVREWIPADEDEPIRDLFDQRPNSRKPVEIPREDGNILVLDSD